MLKWAARACVQVSASEKNVHFLLKVAPWVPLNIAWGGRADSSIGKRVNIESVRYFRSGRYGPISQPISRVGQNMLLIE